MNVHDETSDNDVLPVVSNCPSGIPTANPPDVEAIMARGRARRRHPQGADGTRERGAWRRTGGARAQELMSWSAAV